MCDKIQEDNPKFAEAQAKVAETGCLAQTNSLNQCLKDHNNDWRQCKTHIDDLKICLQNPKQPPSPT